MQVLYNNIIKNNSSITSTNPSSSTDVYNLIDNFLMKKYDSSTSTDTVTITLDDVYACDSFALSYHNLTSAVIKFYNLADSLINTQTLSSLRACEMIYFTEINIKKIVIDLVSSGDIYLGGISAGVNLQLPHFDIVPMFNRKINSFVRQTSGGQVIGQKRSTLRAVSVSFIDIDQSAFDDIMTFIESVQNVVPFFLDVYSGSTAILPFYAKLDIDNFEATQQGVAGLHYNGSMEFIECK